MGIGIVTRKDLENSTFAAWQVAEGPLKEELFEQLNELLQQHAQAVMFQILRYNDPDLVVEAADKVLLALPNFQPTQALFTTWAHYILMHAMYDQRKRERQRKEIPLQTAFDLAGDPSIAQSDVLMTVQEILSPKEQEIFERVGLLGMTLEEAAESLGMTLSTLGRRWLDIKKVLGDAFTK